jgi:hypothetical protein
MEDKETKNIKDAQIDEIKVEDKIEETIEEKKEVKKNDYRTEVILIVVIGVLLGIMLKAEALKRVSIGFDDYAAKTGKQGYDISAIEKKLIQESEDAAASQQAAQGQAGAGATTDTGAEAPVAQ